MKQHRRNKRIAAMQEKRTRGGQDGAPPHIIALIPLHAAVADRTDLIRRLVEVETDAIEHQHASGLTVGYPKMKQRFTIVTPAYFDLCSLLDACKVAGTFVFLYAPIGHVDSFGEILFSSLLAQGVPATAHVVQGFDRFPSKRQTNMKKSQPKVVEKRFPSDRIQILDSDSDVASFLRRVATQKTKHVQWRDKWPHLLIEQTQFQCDSESEEFGTLSVSGYVRGRGLSVDGLIHLPELGDFQMRQIDAPPDPCSLKGRRLMMLFIWQRRMFECYRKQIHPIMRVWIVKLCRIRWTPNKRGQPMSTCVRVIGRRLATGALDEFTLRRRGGNPWLNASNLASAIALSLEFILFKNRAALLICSAQLRLGLV
ncbi:pre-rRNA-processing protein TSR1 homolog [Oscarella lobularis]|uniref:pre-rRNA-processing protein TSR1 homolog n=1 Tax=Oscarella lobularis TaxID=121494 RepID=UPI0033141B36